MPTTTRVAEYASSAAWSGRGTLGQLVAELERQKESKIDFVADQRQLLVRPPGNDGDTSPRRMTLAPMRNTQAGEFLPRDGMQITPAALQQLGQRQTPPVPWAFLKDLCATRDIVAADLLNGLMRIPSRKLIRMLDGCVRAVLSDRFRVIDHYDIAFAALDVARDRGGEVIEASLSDSRMRIKFTSRQVWDAIDEQRLGKQSDWYAGGLGSQTHLTRVHATARDALPGGPGTIHPIVTISNSETGHGGLQVRIGILRAICFNLATVEDVASRVHLGERMDAGVLSAEAIEADNRALMLKVRDSIRAAFDPDKFKLLALRCRRANDIPVRAPQSAVGNIVKSFLLPEAAHDALLNYFLADTGAGGQLVDTTAYGLAQSVSRYAQDVDDPDAAADAEDAAGAILANPGRYALVGA